MRTLERVRRGKFACFFGALVLYLDVSLFGLAFRACVSFVYGQIRYGKLEIMFVRNVPLKSPLMECPVQ